jgi:hypothetical protein
VITFLKSAQLLISLGVIVLFWQVYPGILVVLASAVGMIYVAASIGAVLDNRIAIWVAFIFTTIAAVLSALGVNRFSQKGFDFLVGNFEQQGDFYFPPYLFLIISLGAASVVIAHAASWRWMVRAQSNGTT